MNSEAEELIVLRSDIIVAVWQGVRFQERISSLILVNKKMIIFHSCISCYLPSSLFLPPGMTKSEVTEVMAKFNAGVHKLVICTSAAEEGLDFKACNLVIRYLYEASMVSMIQTRGKPACLGFLFVSLFLFIYRSVKRFCRCCDFESLSRLLYGINSCRACL